MYRVYFSLLMIVLPIATYAQPDWTDLVDCVPEGFVDPEYCTDQEVECEFPESCYVEGGEDNIDEYGESDFECKDLPEECQELTTTEGGDSTTEEGATDPTDDGETTDPDETTTEGTDDDIKPGKKCTPATKPIGGKDACDECCFWAGIGECDRNKFFMRRVCQKSCGTKGANMRNLASMTPKVPKKCRSLPDGGGRSSPIFAAARSSQTSSSTCIDTHQSCRGWSLRGECDTNPLWMHPNCQRSCNTCSSVPARQPVGTPSFISRFCIDFNPSCAGWAAIDECAANRPYMGLACCASCSRIAGR